MDDKKTVWIINQYASTPNTGIGGRHYYFANELVAKGYRVYLVMASYTHWLREPPIVYEPIEEEKENGVNIIRVKIPKYSGARDKKRIRNWFLFAFRLKMLEKKIAYKPDVILYSSMSIIGYLGALRLAKRLQVRLVFEVRDIWPLTLTELGGYSKWHPFIMFMQWIEDKAYRDSDAVISNLKYAFVHMENRGMPREKFFWIPNGFSLQEVSTQLTLEKTVISQIPKEKFLVGYTGSVGLANSLDVLIEAAELLKDYADIAFVIVGDGGKKADLEAQVSDKALNNVVFIDSIPKGAVQSMLDMFQVLWIGAKSSQLYRYGVAMNKLYDYLYAAKPIVYSINSGEYNPVEECGAGIKTLPENPEAISKAITELYNLSEAERFNMGQRGRNFVLRHYEYKDLTVKLKSVLFPDEDKEGKL